MSPRSPLGGSLLSPCFTFSDPGVLVTDLHSRVPSETGPYLRKLKRTCFLCENDTTQFFSNLNKQCRRSQLMGLTLFTEYFLRDCSLLNLSLDLLHYFPGRCVSYVGPISGTLRVHKTLSSPDSVSVGLWNESSVWDGLGNKRDHG